MTDIPNPDSGMTNVLPPRRRRPWWLWVGAGVVTAGILTSLLLEAVDRVREAAARAD